MASSRTLGARRFQPAAGQLLQVRRLPARCPGRPQRVGQHGIGGQVELAVGGAEGDQQVGRVPFEIAARTADRRAQRGRQQGPHVGRIGVLPPGLLALGGGDARRLFCLAARFSRLRLLMARSVPGGSDSSGSARRAGENMSGPRAPARAR